MSDEKLLEGALFLYPQEFAADKCRWVKVDFIDSYVAQGWCFAYTRGSSVILKHGAASYVLLERPKENRDVG